MRLPYTKKLVKDKIHSKLITIYGRLRKGDQYAQDLFNPSYHYRVLYQPSEKDIQGWMYLESSRHVALRKLKSILHDIVYIYKLLNNKYTIYIIRKNQEHEYYYNVEKRDVMNKIGLGYNGYIYYDGVIDKDHSMLNEFKKVLDN